MFEPITDIAIQNIDVRRDDVNYYTTANIAFCKETSRFVTLECELTYVTNSCDKPKSFWFHEFAFSIRCSDFLTNQAYDIQDRNIARNHIPDTAVKFVMPLVLTSLDIMIRKVKPISIYRVAKTAHLPEKAMRKHNLITQKLLDMSYSMFEQGTDDFDRPFWLMAR
jgi:hypothetical protein